MSDFKSVIKRTVFYGIILTVYVTVLTVFDIRCPIAAILGVRCPTCGVSRAIISFLTLDIERSFSYHPLAIPMVISVWIMINLESFRHRTVAETVAILTVILNFILYLFKMIL